MLDIDTSYTRRTFRVRDLTTGQVTMRQAIIWHPKADAGEAVSRNTATRMGGGGRVTQATSEELEPEKMFLPEPEADESGEDSSDD